MSTIHTFGESHAGWHGGWRDVKVFDHHINFATFTPATLMNTFGRDKLTVVGPDVNPGDIVVFCYGETDCRMHYWSRDADYKEDIERNVRAYCEAIKTNVENKDVITFLFNIVPTYKPLHPNARGTNIQILKYTKYMNEQLAIHAEEFGFRFLDVYGKYSDEHGWMIPELCDKICHITEPKYISEFLENSLRPQPQPDVTD